MYRVIIIEDDPMVAAINRQYIELNRHLKVVGQFTNGEDALHYLSEHPADLAVMDVYMPVMDGITLLKKIRNLGYELDVIMVTAANDIQQIKTLLSFGVIDYLVKPFEYIRLNHALALFIQHREMLDFPQKSISQNELDELLHITEQPHTNTEPLRKGLQPKTLELILSYMKQHADLPLTSESIAAEIGLSRVTIRRYMNYLLEKKQITSDINYTTGGRPSIIYRYSSSGNKPPL